MRSVLNESNYAELLSKTLPRVIHTDAQLEEYTGALLELDELDQPSREERELADLLTTLIEHYETAKYSLRKSIPTEMIAFLMEQRGIPAKDLWPVIGSKGNTSEILSGRRKIGLTIASRLGGFFHVDPELFVNWSKQARA